MKLGGSDLSVENWIKSFVALIGLATFLFGIVKFVQVQAVEAEKPYLERKLAWCEQAVETTAIISTSIEPAQEDLDRFWQMYWGVMGLIERNRSRLQWLTSEKPELFAISGRL